MGALPNPPRAGHLYGAEDHGLAALESVTGLWRFKSFQLHAIQIGHLMTDATTEELTEFFEFMWHDTEAFVYLPVKTNDGSPLGRWTTFTFSWPRQKAGVVRHVLKWTSNPDTEVFFAPGMFKTARPAKEAVLGAWVLWVDFDGNAPEDWDKVTAESHVPRPSLVVQSSIEGHNHCYWALDEFVSNRSVLEDRNRSLAYVLHADTSGWDADQILRPIHTINRKRDMPVHVKEWSE